MLHIIFSKTIFRLENLDFALFALNNSRQIKKRARKLNFRSVTYDVLASGIYGKFTGEFKTNLC